MPNAFNFQASPFDCLAADEQQIVRAGVDIACFREGDAILDASIAAELRLEQFGQTY